MGDELLDLVVMGDELLDLVVIPTRDRDGRANQQREW